ncbi:MAG: hypothetical protein JWR12_80 [Mucilaginibacter sp.]|jgi:hypothetical protein|nr:hypothetical protein [Mucilaginibacter sp.]
MIELANWTSNKNEKEFSMLTKDKVKELVNHMPETFSVDDIVGEIILLQKVEMARKQVQDGGFLTEEELDREIDQWD